MWCLSFVFNTNQNQGVVHYEKTRVFGSTEKTRKGVE